MRREKEYRLKAGKTKEERCDDEIERRKQESIEGWKIVALLIGYLIILAGLAWGEITGIDTQLLMLCYVLLSLATILLLLEGTTLRHNRGRVKISIEEEEQKPKKRR